MGQPAVSLLLLGCSAVLVCLRSLPGKGQFPWISFGSIALIFLFTLSYGLGPSGAIFAVIMEIFGQSVRPSALTIVGMVSWVGLFVVGMTFPFLVEVLGHFCFLLFFVVLLVVGSFIYRYLPETKGRSISEITEEFNRMRWGKRMAFTAQGASTDHSFCTKL